MVNNREVKHRNVCVYLYV